MVQYSLRELFLRKFIRELINNTKIKNLPTLKKETEIKKEKIENLFQEKIEKISKLDSHMISSLAPTPQKRFAPISVTKLTINPTKPIKENSPGIKKVNKVITRNQNTVIQPKEGNPDFGKLNILISDPGVESIECLGPNKYILVKKHGKVQRTNILLTKEEIKKILGDFSQKTKIPLTEGTFKAALGSLILTAILSEFVGTKFILQKKNPAIFQKSL